MCRGALELGREPLKGLRCAHHLRRPLKRPPFAADNYPEPSGVLPAVLVRPATDQGP